MTIVLGPQGLPSSSSIQAQLPNGQQLLVLSGIAEPDWVIDTGNLSFQDFEVRLGKFVLAINQVTVTTGLASVANGNSAFTWALNSAYVSVDPDTGELLLNVSAAALGSHTAVSRFGYQVVAVVQPITVQITVEVAWSQSLWSPPAGDLQAVGEQITVTAGEILPGSGQSFGSVQTIATGSPTAMRESGTTWFAVFEITAVPLYRQLTVQVSPGSAFTPPPGEPIAVVPVSGPGQFTLTQSDPQAQLIFSIQPVPSPLG